MYPAASAVSSDLPDNITLRNVGSLSKSGTGYGNTTNGIILESGVWARYIDGVRSTKACLISGDGNLTPGDDVVEDQFEAAYNVNLLDSDYTIERRSLCSWDALPEKGFRLEYNDNPRDLYPNDSKWYFTDFDDVQFIWIGEKIGNQNTPEGSYLLYQLDRDSDPEFEPTGSSLTCIVSSL
jgi:hypothetical protein